jgi:hypothetical protein
VRVIEVSPTLFETLPHPQSEISNQFQLSSQHRFQLHQLDREARGGGRVSNIERYIDVDVQHWTGP